MPARLSSFRLLAMASPGIVSEYPFFEEWGLTINRR
jgi:hypothetical protein